MLVSNDCSHEKPAAYIGRFAPSPSGPLHMGSLVCALASFLDARSNSGQWRVRIEDIDPPREQRGADKLILSSLEAHGLIWDGPVVYQSQRTAAYNDTLNQLISDGYAYRCNCTRARLKSINGRYDQHCLNNPPAKTDPAAIRLNLASAHSQLNANIDQALQSFDDGVLGLQQTQNADDFVIHRKDGLYAYQLAVVVDDIAQQVSHVVRGADLLDTTAKQRLLFYLLGTKPPHYSHIALITNSQGDKLSKQNHAPAIQLKLASENLVQACTLLNLFNSTNEKLNLGGCPPNDILTWAINRWSLQRLPCRPVAVQSDFSEGDL